MYTLARTIGISEDVLLSTLNVVDKSPSPKPFLRTCLEHPNEPPFPLEVRPRKWRCLIFCAALELPPHVLVRCKMWLWVNEQKAGNWEYNDLLEILTSVPVVYIFWSCENSTVISLGNILHILFSFCTLQNTKELKIHYIYIRTIWVRNGTWFTSLRYRLYLIGLFLHRQHFHFEQRVRVQFELFIWIQKSESYFWKSSLFFLRKHTNYRPAVYFVELWCEFLLFSEINLTC